MTGDGGLTHVHGMRAEAGGRARATRCGRGALLGLALAGCSTAPSATPGASGMGEARAPATAPAHPGEEPAPPPALAITPARPGPAPVLTPEISEARAYAERRMLGRAARPEPATANAPSPTHAGSPADAANVGTASAAPVDPPAGAANANGGTAAGPAPVPADSLGTFVLIEDPAPDRPALARFHAALRELAAGRDADGKVRVLMYGASGTAADLFTGYVRAYLQRRFGAGGPGFVPAARMNGWYRHSEVTVESSKQWAKENAVRKTRPPEEPRLGLMGVSFRTTSKRAHARVIPGPGWHGATLTGELYAWRGPGGGRLQVRRGGKPLADLATRASAPGLAYVALPPGPGDQAIEVTPRGGGLVRLYGVVLEREGPGVVVDTLGLEGARAANQLVWDEATWAEHLRRRAPDLVVLSYGTNEATDMDVPIEVYRRELGEVLARHRRAAPEASCILLGPSDFPAGEPRLTAILAVQRELAVQVGCGYWDAQAFMGGPGSMHAWVASDPPLAQADGLHTTRRGSVKKGVAFADALMHAYDAADAR